MFSSALPVLSSSLRAAAPVRGMATLKDISTRLKSVRSIKKITSSMKMVSAAKFSRTERSLNECRAIGPSSYALIENAGVQSDNNAPTQIFIAVSSDRGLCGGIHSSIAKAVKNELPKRAKSDVKLVIIGDKNKTILQRTHRDQILLSVNEVGRALPQFADAVFISDEILKSGHEFTVGTLFFNFFKSKVSWQTQQRPLLTLAGVESNEALHVFDNVDTETLTDYMHFMMASNIYYCMMEGATSELSARMSAMENASSNAGDMIHTLQLTFNRTRQAVITRELIEIISGAAALN